MSAPAAAETAKEQKESEMTEAERRDHRRIGRLMELFFVAEEAVGSVFWQPNGWQLYKTLKEYLSKQLISNGYLEIATPTLLNQKLWETSGHWDKFRENMFVVDTDRHTTEEDEEHKLGKSAGGGTKEVLAVKPMNCPGHVLVFKKTPKSFRDLPLRLSEFGSVHRNEITGALTGLMRVRAFTQDDAHIFCTEQQINEETKSFVQLLLKVYRDLGFEEVTVKFSDRPEKRAGDDSTWDNAETALKSAIEDLGLDYELAPGEGAFYGPKLEFQVKDALGRFWQCGTIQLDFVLPARFDATFTDSDGQKKNPVMLHRAIFGSFERFLGILIENCEGKFPFWLAPLQVTTVSITDDDAPAARDLAQKLRAVGVRAEADTRAEKLSYKIRENTIRRVPVQLVIGAREREAGTVAVRRIGSRDQQILPVEEVLKSLEEDAKLP